LLCKQFQLLIISRVVGHQGVLTVVVHDHPAVVQLDDCRVSVGVLDGQVQGGLAAPRTHHHQLDVVHQAQRLGDGGSLVEQVLRP
jgi:hypothetical protein